MTMITVLAGVFVLGVLTAVSPCPLTTNIAAISFLSRDVSNSRRVLLSALLYTAGRTLVYVGLGMLLLWGFQSLAGGAGGLEDFAGPVSRQVQRYGNLVLGPVLLLVGMILLNLLEVNFSFGVGGIGLQNRLAKGGAIWALPLGGLFALAFCPPSAIMFLAAMGVSLEHDSLLLPPLVYGIGTAVPVLGFALLIAFGGQYLGKAFNNLAQVERWIRFAAGSIVILVGIYTILKYMYGVPVPGIPLPAF